MNSYSPYHAQYLAHRLTLEGVGDEAFARSLSAARVEMKPHQVDAALFALKSPLSTRLKPTPYGNEVGREVWNYLKPVKPLSDTRRHLFHGFNKCCYSVQRFQSDDERRFAVLIDGKHEPQVRHWIKPATKQFDIHYARGSLYQPDFLVETDQEMLICEVKARNELDDPIVKAKAGAARLWVAEANKVASEIGKRLWRYVLIPHDAITESSTLQGIIGRYGQT